MTKDNQKSLPPVIRVFLSSTFADMDRERSYFNEVLVPKLNRLCAERGVSFFSVDLRWGITEEEQVDGKVLPICLSEIDKCRPYFIGILGNRYGSILETVPDKISEVIPWLRGKEGHSITELEMLYAVLEHTDEETVANSAFYFRSDDLTEQLYGHLKQEDEVALENLRKLKQTIEADNDTPCSRYNSIEEFGSFVMRDILNWLDRHFPESEDIDAIRSEWYNSEILRNHVENNEFNSFLDSYVLESSKPLLVYGDGARGKTSSLTYWTPKNAHKILVNCGADDKFAYWPSIAEDIVKQLRRISENVGDDYTLESISNMERFIDIHRVTYSDSKKVLYFLMENSLEKFRRLFIKWLSELNTKENIIIVINDLNLLDGERSKLLCWLPSTTNGRIKLVCSTNDDDMVDSAEVLGWNTKEMPLLNKTRAQNFVRDYLGTFGKSFSNAQLEAMLNSEAAKYPGLLRFIIRFLINHGRFENLDTLIKGLSNCTEIQQIYHYIYDFLICDYSSNEQQITRTVFGLVRSSYISLTEQECFKLAQNSCEISPIEWANICRTFEQLEIIHGDYWNVRNEETEKFIDGILSDWELTRSHEILGDYIVSRLSENESERSPRIGSAYSKASLLHYQNAKSWNKLISALGEHSIISCLYLSDWQYIRSAWMQLFLYSDVDFTNAISDIARQYHKKKDYYSYQIRDKMIGLLTDFEFIAELDILCNSLEVNNPGGTIDKSSVGLSDNFINHYRKILELTSGTNYRQLYDFVNKLYAEKNKYSEMDICQILYVKSDTEVKLAYYTDAIETANEYYRLALKMGFFFELRKALSTRSNALFRLNRLDEAMRIAKRSLFIALSEGEIRTYLGDLNLMAMIYYRQGKCDESIAIYDELFKHWTKIGNVKELSVTVLNRCNALSYKGDDKAALASAEEWYSFIKRDAKLLSISTTLLGNMASYAYEAKEYQTAEKYFCLAAEIAEREGFEITLLKAYNGLIELYKSIDNVSKRIDIYNKKLELLWSRKDYDELITTLKAAIDELLILKHTRQAQQMEDYWQKKFSTVNGGSSYFETRFNSSDNAMDSVSLDTLEEQLIIARSEGNVEKIYGCIINIVDALGKNNISKSIDYLISALDILIPAGNETGIVECIARAAELVFENGTLKYPEHISSVMDKVRDDSFAKIIDIWRRIGEDKDADVYTLLNEMTSYIPKYEYVVVNAFEDLRYYAVDKCSGEELVSLVKKLTVRRWVNYIASKWEEVMLKDLHKNEAKLVRDYMSSEAVELISYFEKCIVFLRVFDKSNAATFAGNIAIIFRRRGDKEKTLYYHDLSMRIFDEENKHRDCLIEMTNLATAYNAFGEPDKAIELLRKALVRATKVGDEQQRALIADNLADFLRIRKNPENQSEILECFAIGESFFRKAGYTRDLVISLRNQLVYYVVDLEAPIEVWEAKLIEVAKLVRENEFTEFEQNIHYFEWRASQCRSNGGGSTIQEVKDKLHNMLNNVLDEYHLEEAEESDGYYKFIAYPKDQENGREEYHIFIDKQNDNSLHFIPAYLPNCDISNHAKLDEYIGWWNQIGNYALERNEEVGYVTAHFVLMANSWEDVCDTFKRSIILWLVDKTATLLLMTDACDLAEIQGFKLSVYNS